MAGPSLDTYGAHGRAPHRGHGRGAIHGAQAPAQLGAINRAPTRGNNAPSFIPRGWVGTHETFAIQIGKSSEVNVIVYAICLATGPGMAPRAQENSNQMRGR